MSGKVKPLLWDRSLSFVGSYLCTYIQRGGLLTRFWRGFQIFTFYYSYFSGGLTSCSPIAIMEVARDVASKGKKSWKWMPSGHKMIYRFRHETCGELTQNDQTCPSWSLCPDMIFHTIKLVLALLCIRKLL